MGLEGAVARRFDAQGLACPVNKTRWHQLVVLGNGFDLACGLPSRFSSFFEPRRALIYPELGQGQVTDAVSWSEHLRANGLTAWDVILDEEHPNDSWCDIEDTVTRWVAPCGQCCDGDGPLGGVLGVVSAEHYPEHSPCGLHNYRWERYEGARDRLFEHANIARLVLAANPAARDGSWRKADMLAYLLEELHAFEEQFRTYLSGAVEALEGYKERCNELFSKICLDAIPRVECYDVQTSVLDFNYTRPTWKEAPRHLDALVVNIHGSLSGEIVFGIEGKDCITSPETAPFTKTYRLMALHTSLTHDLLYTASCDRPFDDTDNVTDVIKFFGHALGEADYSYFQSIFDGVDLYGSNTGLVFYYKPHGDAVGSDRDKHKMLQKVTRLLSTYGHTLDNRDHGKNLIHKLLIEGRLSVRELK